MSTVRPGGTRPDEPGGGPDRSDQELDLLRPHPFAVLVRLQPGRPAVAVGLRMATVICVPMIVGVSIGKLVPATAVCLGALNAGMADVGGARPSRWHALTAAMVLNAVAIAVGTLAGQSMGAALPLMFVVAFASGMANLFGNVSANVGFVVCILFMVGVGTPGDGADTFERLWLTALGGAWAIVVVLVLWPVRPFEVASSAVAECCTDLARLLRSLTEHPDDGPDGVPPEYLGTPQQVRAGIARARAALVATRAQRRGDSVTGRRLLDVLRAAKRLFAEAEGWSATRTVVRPGPYDAGRSAEADAVLAAAADDLDVMAAVTRRMDKGVTVASRSGLEPMVGGLVDRLDEARRKAALASVEEVAAAAALQRMVAAVGDMARALGGSTDVLSSDLPVVATAGGSGQPVGVPGRNAPTTDRVGGVVQTVRSNLQIGSMVARHALRLATTATAGLAIAMGAHLDKGYWITLTIAVVMRPFAAATLERALLRVAGTVLGAALTAVLVTGVTNRVQLIAAMFVLALLAFSLMPLNYAVGVVFLTPLVIVLISIAAPGGWELAVHRIVNTLIGGALALIGGYLLWPNSNRVELVDALDVSLDANRQFLDAALDAVLVPPDRRDLAGIDALHRSAGVALDNLVAGFQQLLGEPTSRSRPVDIFWSLTESSRLIFVGAVAIEHQLHVMPAAHDLPEVVAIHRQFDQALSRATASIARTARRGSTDGPDARARSEHRVEHRVEQPSDRVEPMLAAAATGDVTVVVEASRTIGAAIWDLQAELAELAEATTGRRPDPSPG